MTKVQNLLSLMGKGMKTEQTFIKKVSYYVIHNAAHANVNFHVVHPFVTFVTKNKIRTCLCFLTITVLSPI